MPLLKRTVQIGLICLGQLAILSGPAHAADKAEKPAPASASQVKAAAAAINAATSELQKSYEAHLSKPSTPLHTESDYLKKDRNPAISPEVIIIALGRGYGSPATSLYVHWQLLSGLPDKVDPALAPRLAAMLAAAPVPQERPGMGLAAKSELDRAVMGKAETDATAVNSLYSKLVEKWKAEQDPIIVYRDEIFKHLPITTDSLREELKDAAVRAGAGIDADTLGSNFLNTTKTWAAVDAKPGETVALADGVADVLNMISRRTSMIEPEAGHIQVLAQVLAALRPVAKKPSGAGRKGNYPGGGASAALFPPSYYDAVEWDSKSRTLKWKTGTAKFVSKGSLEELQTFLRNQKQDNGDTLTVKGK